MRTRYLLLIPVGLVVLLVAVVLLYTKVIADDAPERLTFAEGPPPTVAGATPTTSGSAGGLASGVDGTWKTAPGSTAGYRAQEILFGQSVTAVGRTEKVTGDMTIQGNSVTAATFTVDMTTVKSDRSQRDGQFHGRIMNTSQFPTAEFVLTSPISFGTMPADRADITVLAKGRLTLKGKANDVSFELKARRNGSNIEVNGTIPVKFSDYGIDNPSGGPAQVGDAGEVEVLLVFTRA